MDRMPDLVLHIAGARPNFPKAAPVVGALDRLGVPQQLVHTGQHYDSRLSDVFFRQLGLPEPDINLGVGSGSHATQTAAIMTGLERVFLEHRPSLVMVYGDVNSTVAAALVTAKMLIPLAHVEAGLRSFDMTMPEEVNRRITDQLAELLFVTSPEAIGHLANEGIAIERIHFVGNPMIDTLLDNLEQFDTEKVRGAHELPERYVVVTLHRPSNVDDPVIAKEIVTALHQIADDADVFIPLHPRGRAVMERAGLSAHPRVRVEHPVGYIEFMSLVRGAVAIVTDSGGVQEETTVLGVPCLTIRPNTERPITVTHGTNRLVARDGVVDAYRQIADEHAQEPRVPPLWDGKAGERIANIVTRWMVDRS
jgi:UDP-N-acetylglucosamine 2-epimerase